jgi:hypothetical protein
MFHPDKKINKEILELNDIIDLMNLTYIYRVLHLESAKSSFFSAAHGTFSKTDHILGHKASLNKFNKIEITPCILSNHNTMKLEHNNKSSSKKFQSCRD